MEYHITALVCLAIFSAGSFGVPLSIVDTEDPALIEQILQPYQQGCEANTGSLETYKRLQSSLQYTVNCFNGLESHQSNVQYKANLTRTNECDQVPPSLHCFEPTINSFARCLPRDTKTNALVIKDIIKALWQTICRHGEAIESVIIKDPSCVVKIRLFGEECKAPFVKLDTPWSDLDANECRSVTNSKSCMKLKLESCGGDVLMNVLDAFYNSIRCASECEKYDDPDNFENEI